MSGSLARGWGRIEQSLLRNPQFYVALVCLVCFVAPGVMVVQGAFRTAAFGDPEWSMAAVVEVITKPRTWEVAGTTLLMGAVTVVLSTLGAVVFAAIYTRTRTPLRRLIPVVMAIVVATPGLFYAISWGFLGNARIGVLNNVLAMLFGEGARIIDMESWWGIVFVSTFRLIALQFFLLLGPFLAMDQSLDEAARISGASPVRAFFQVQLPVLLPAITGVVILAFILFLESFDIAQILGVPAGIYVIPTEIYSYLSQASGPQYGHASVISIMLMVVLAVLVFVQVRVLGRRGFTTVGGKGSKELLRDVGPWKWLLSAFVLVYAVLATVLPLIQLFLVSMSPFLGATGNLGWRNYEEIFGMDRLMQSYGNTAVIAFFGGLLAITAATLFTWAARFRGGALARFIEFSQWIALAMPGIVLALGVLWFFLGVEPLQQFYATPVILVFALFVTTIPVASRATAGAMAQISRQLEEAAWQSGASKPRALVSIVGRLILPSFLNGWVLTFVVICGAFSAPLILTSQKSVFMSVEIYRLYTEGRAPMAAAAYMLFLAGLAVIGIVVGLARLAAAAVARSRRSDGPASPQLTSILVDPGPDRAGSATETLVTVEREPAGRR